MDRTSATPADFPSSEIGIGSLANAEGEAAWNSGIRYFDTSAWRFGAYRATSCG